MFYVYEWYDKNTGYIFYVGKGCNKRKGSISQRNKLFKEYIKTHDCAYRTIKTFESEADAFAYERERIMSLKEKGQCSCNLDNGGSGGVNFVWTDEMRKYKSVYNPMKEATQRKRMSNNNPMKNKETATSVGKKHRKPVIINGKKYSGVLVASKETGVAPATIKKWCEQGYDFNGKPCRYETCEQKEFVFKQYNLGNSRKIIYNGKEYPSAVWIAKELGCHYSTVHHWAKKGFDPKGIPCRYADDTTEHVFIPATKTPYTKPIEVNGIVYPSTEEAARQLGIKSKRIYSYLKGIRQNKNYVCRYVNQQPSRGNSDKSTSEGSETNG